MGFEARTRKQTSLEYNFSFSRKGESSYNAPWIKFSGERDTIPLSSPVRGSSKPWWVEPLLPSRLLLAIITQPPPLRCQFSDRLW
ncbi:hypothetical protein KP509_37G015900 [Ceratopteris richardii]|nr:hypothetical protein KP509_37G015900 [Ceratopteris richardii]